MFAAIRENCRLDVALGQIVSAAAVIDFEENLFARFDRLLAEKGYLAKGGQIIDGAIVEVPKQRNNDEEKQAIRQGEAPEAWKDKPASLPRRPGCPMDSEAGEKGSETPGAVEIAIPVFG